MQGFAARLMLFAEQTALDGGKTPLAWLLTGFADPSPHLWSTKKRQGVKPYSRLAAPTWMAANLAYLKDLDYLETRMNNVGRSQASNSPPLPDDTAPAEEELPNRRPRRARGRGGGGGSS